MPTLIPLYRKDYSKAFLYAGLLLMKQQKPFPSWQSGFGQEKLAALV